MPAVMAFSQIVFDAHQAFEFIAHTLDAALAEAAGSREKIFNARKLWGAVRVPGKETLSSAVGEDCGCTPTAKSIVQMAKCPEGKSRAKEPKRKRQGRHPSPKKQDN